MTATPKVAKQTEIVVVGGGVAGAAAALLLANQDRTVTVIDSQPLATDWPGNDLDPRVIALSPGSASILESVGAWPLAHPERIAAYHRMQVCSGRGQVRFQADQHGLTTLGWIVEIPALRQALWEQLEGHSNVELLCPAQVVSLDQADLHQSEQKQASVRIKLDDGTRLRAELVIAADGSRSRLRQAAGIKLDEWHYNQHALIAPIRTDHPNKGIAWQRFTEHGPLALLPLPDGRSSIVWSQSSDRALKQSNGQDDASVDELVDELNRHQDSPMGKVTEIGARHALPLIRRRAHQLVRGRLVLIGDAARSVHPLAGQGQNLGLADAAALAECIAEGSNNRFNDRSNARLTATSAHQSLDRALRRYQRWRRSASEMVGGGIHAINETARLPMGLGQHVLGAGFIAANALWPAREMLIERACGFDSDSPELAQRARLA